MDAEGAHGSPRGVRARASAHEGPLVALGACLVIELAAHGPWPAPAPLPSVLLVTSLLAVVHASLRAGFLSGLASAAVLGLYAAHLFSPHRAGILLEDQPLRSGFLVFFIGGVMAAAMARVKRREDRLKEATAQKARELEARNRELRRTNEMLEAFTYVVGHDLKEPVRAIENYLEAAEEEYGTEEGRSFLRRARDSNRRMAGLLQGLLSYGRVSVVADAHPVPLGALLGREDVRSQFDHLLAERGGTLEVAPDLPVVWADEVALGQAVGNLVLNAIRHNPRPLPAVRVRAGPVTDGAAEIHVDDDGPGFPPEVRRRFEGDVGPSTIKGGFGLLITHRALQRMGGALRLGQSPEGGGRATLVLPLPPKEP